KGITQEMAFFKCLPGERLVTFGKDGKGTAWDLVSGEARQRFEATAGPIHRHAVSGSGRLLAVAILKEDSRSVREPPIEIRVWDLESFKQQPVRVIPWEGYFDLEILAGEELLIAQTHGTGVRFLPRIKLLEK